jgi:chromosome segregation ATPase
MAWSFVKIAEQVQDYRGHSLVRIILRSDSGEQDTQLDFETEPAAEQLQAVIDNLVHDLNAPPPHPPTPEEVAEAALRERIAEMDLARKSVDTDNYKLRTENKTLKDDKATLEADNATLEADKATLEAAKAALAAENQSLKDELAKVKEPKP